MATKRKGKKKSGALHQAGRILDGEVGRIEEWCVGRVWWGRAVLLIFFGYVGVCHYMDPTYESIFKGLNLGLHELGHMVFAPFGEFMGIAGGSLFQCLVPLIGMTMFRLQRDYFGIAVAFGWLSTNLFDVATYAEDARSMELPLVSPFGGGGEIIHDWNWLLMATNALQYDHAIAQLLRLSGVTCMLICVLFGAWLCWEMFRHPKVAAVAPELIN